MANPWWLRARGTGSAWTVGVIFGRFRHNIASQNAMNSATHETMTSGRRGLWLAR